MFVEFVLRHSADAAGAELTVSLLDALEAAKPFIPGLLPFGDQSCISPLLLQAVIV